MARAVLVRAHANEIQDVIGVAFTTSFKFMGRLIPVKSDVIHNRSRQDPCHPKAWEDISSASPVISRRTCSVLESSVILHPPRCPITPEDVNFHINSSSSELIGTLGLQKFSGHSTPSFPDLYHRVTSASSMASTGCPLRFSPCLSCGAEHDALFKQEEGMSTDSASEPPLLAVSLPLSLCTAATASALSGRRPLSRWASILSAPTTVWHRQARPRLTRLRLPSSVLRPPMMAQASDNEPVMCYRSNSGSTSSLQRELTDDLLSPAYGPPRCILDLSMALSEEMQMFADGISTADCLHAACLFGVCCFFCLGCQRQCRELHSPQRKRTAQFSPAPILLTTHMHR
ncbi:LOW QUALITY PROTEIN: hypothetical protein CVT26_001224 [Gymnopilus dilepis]|uniref:Uncharacterized protein n=1 Tax=Gymnopilus dilepis TaxID=231916 RepID=A0A409WBI4_9AGAR|nr:LOW QUALITY PROTEIN: hypothetical protein CVT26_001224 [Gymnopilus dilepis]